MVLVKLAPDPSNYLRELYGPVRILWAQVLKRAIFDYVMLRKSKKLKDRRDFVSAERWLFSSDVGLIDACKVFGWPLERLRERAREMTSVDVRKMEFRDRECFTTGEAVGIGDGDSR
jgi:hypothetical protein